MKESNKEKKKIGRYRPLVVLIVIVALEAGAVVFGLERGFFDWMHFFMGLFLCKFAMLKLFHLSDFADGFQKYDLVARKFRVYAYVYPFIELGLGIAYLSFIGPIATYVVTILIMGIGTIGVVRALKRGLDIRCACMGTILDVPLSTVTLSEDIAMGAMACFMLIASL